MQFASAVGGYRPAVTTSSQQLLKQFHKKKERGKKLQRNYYYSTWYCCVEVADIDREAVDLWSLYKGNNGYTSGSTYVLRSYKFCYSRSILMHNANR